MSPNDAIDRDSPASLRKRGERDRYSIVLTRAAAREVDRAAIESYAMPGIVLMENAARGLTEAAIDLLDQYSRGRQKPEGDGTSANGPQVLIVCGGGNNGGDGYALARHLHNAGIVCTLVVLSDPKPGSDAAINRDICRRMKLPEVAADAWASLTEQRVDLLVDAIFGTGLDRDVSGRAREVIEWINERRVPVLSVDVPSGLDCDTGRTHGVCVRASMTVTFAGLKPAFQQLDIQKLIGEVRVADIGVPRELIEHYGQRLPSPPGAADTDRSTYEAVQTDR